MQPASEHGRTAAATALAAGGGVAAFAVLDMLGPGITTTERAAYVVVVLLVAVAAARSVLHVNLDRQGWLLLAGWVALVALWMIPSAAHRHLYPTYVAGDLLSLLLPAMLFVVGLANPAVFGRRAVSAGAAALVAGALVAALLGYDEPRHEAPAAFAVAVAWYRVATARGGLRLTLWLVAAIALLLLGFSSGQRTSLVIWAGGAIFALIVGLMSRRLTPVALSVTALATLALAGPVIGESIKSAVRGTRHETLITGERDPSVLARLAEAGDVMRTFETEGPSVRWFTGLGHGATYQPNVSFVSRNVTDEGRVHNVHIGPLLAWFRYGAIGASLWVLLVIWAARSALTVVRQGDTPRATFGFATLTILIEGLAFNVFVDPLFAYAVAGLLLWHRPRPGIE